MSGREFSVDGTEPTGLGLPDDEIDRLADYLGGALAGTPAEAEIARRVREEPTWRHAHETLAAGATAVSADLRAWGGAAEPMPVDVADRLAAALRDAGPARHVDATVRDDAPEQPGDGAPGGLTLVPGSGRPDRPRRRWTRWAGPLAAAAAVLAFCGFGLQALPHITTDQGDSSSSDSGAAAPMFDGDDAEAPAEAPEAGQNRALGGLPIRRLTATGADYRRGDMGATGGGLASNGADGRSAPPSASASASASAGGGAPRLAESDVDPALRRLTSPGALATCLGAIGDEHRLPGTGVDLVDYALFEGSPALVVIFTDAGGARQAWVVGPDCGLPDAGADTRYHANVG